MATKTRYFNFIPLFFFIPSLIIAQKKSGTDLEKMNLNGQVKTINTIYYAPVTRDGQVVKGKPEIGKYGDPHSSEIFNGSGNLLKEVTFEDNGKKIATTIHQYSPTGYRTKTNYTNHKNGTLAYTTYDYDKQKKLVSEKTTKTLNSGLNLRLEKVYRYNAKGKVISEITYKADRKIDQSYTYKYDANGNPYEHEWYASFWTDKDDRIRKYINSFDSKGNEINSKTYNSKGELQSTRINKYDIKGNLIEMTLSLPPDPDYPTPFNKPSIFKYRYSFDKKGNWIKKINYKNRKPEKVVERRIEYFSF